MLEAIANQAKIMLDQQRAYFKTKQGHPGKYQALNASKAEEAKLRQMVAEAAKDRPDDSKLQERIAEICILITELFQWQQTFFHAPLGSPERNSALVKCREDLEPKLRQEVKSALAFVNDQQTPSLF